jgi:uncharacterized protein YkwD
MVRTALAAALGAALVLVATIEPALAMDAGMVLPDDPAVASLVSSEQSMLDLTNADRVANGDDPLQFDPDLLAIARERAESQLGTPSLSHYDTDGHLVFARLLNESNLTFDLAGENLARAGSLDLGLTQRVEQALMQSPLHRKNILERTFKRIAIGAATDPNTGQIAFAEIYRD